MAKKQPPKPPVDDDDDDDDVIVERPTVAPLTEGILPQIDVLKEVADQGLVFIFRSMGRAGKTKYQASVESPRGAISHTKENDDASEAVLDVLAMIGVGPRAVSEAFDESEDDED